ncbi:alpha/beta hydrolase [Swingsia samuiensis]|uniref:Alpha/beta fold hydrolase n=1 Tax=Swingsia samuiensis TaxID=1293412 RepID=A0A4Y6UIJ8_9PROT|nr:alpha/beta fold hydrolase [Swingsia samuiensis]QDH17449.1 alpha/beta fold hydrolase [Swingsia samuiensis]
MISTFFTFSNHLIRLSSLFSLLWWLSACTPPHKIDLHPTSEETALIPPDALLTMSDGVPIPLRIYQASVPPKAVILALHGFGDSRDAWEFFAPPLSQAGIIVVSPDQRGFGATMKSQDWSTTDRMVKDTQEELIWAHNQYPPLPLYLMGESMGGAVALMTDTQPPPFLSGTILLAPAALDIGQPWRMILSLIDALAPHWKLDGSSVPGHRIASDNMKAMRRMYFDPLTQHNSTIHPLYGLTELMKNAFQKAPHVKPPVLMIFGGQDQFVTPQYTKRLINRLPTSTRIDEFPTAHHLLSRDKRRIPQDIISWIFTPQKPLPSGGDIAAAVWNATAQPN